MANNISADLQLDVVLNSAMEAFKEALTPLALFSTAFNNVPLQGTDKIVVPYYPLETAASVDFNGTYAFAADSDTEDREVTVNKRKYQPLTFTSDELRRQPAFNPATLGRIKGLKLAQDVLVDIWSQVTNANYGAAVFTGAAADLDVDDIIDIDAAVTAANWPLAGRGLILSPTYIGELKKDLNANGGLATFNIDTNGAIQQFPTIQGFSVSHSNIVPANAENLVGMVTYPSAMLVAMSPIAPAPEVAKVLSRYEVASDPATGISLEYREWGDPDTDAARRVIECNYGYGLGEAAALKRIVSA